MKGSMTLALHWLQFSDSALPVGAFSFSNGVETAVHEGSLRTSEELEAFVRTALRQSATLDGVAALSAYRLVAEGKELAAWVALDRQLTARKLNEEARGMSQRMGKKLVQLACHLYSDTQLEEWNREIAALRSPGNYAVAQGILFALSGNSEEELFCTHCYGLANQMTGAALRLMKISHYDTQRLLFNLSGEIGALYNKVSQLPSGEMHSFAPEMDLWASLHEKGTVRMFMN